MSELRDHIQTWVSHTLANRAVVEQLKETDAWTGRIKGLPSVAAMAENQGAVDDLLRARLQAYADRLLASGKTLPTWESKVPEVSPDAFALVRVSTLRQLLKQRAASWGAERQCLPVGAVENCLVEIDAVVTRHAMQMRGAS